MQRERIVFARNALHPCTLQEPTTTLIEFDDQAVQQRHRIELHLVGQSHAAVEGKRHVGRHIGAVHPVGAETGGCACFEFLAGGGDALLGLRVGVGVFALYRNAVRLAVLHQPFLAFAVALHILTRGLLAMLGDDLGQLCALQQ
jgi:hypothetical protein